MRLRRVLGPDSIETTGDGYRLRLDGDAVDTHAFERLVGPGPRARRRARAGTGGSGVPAGAVAVARSARCPSCRSGTRRGPRPRGSSRYAARPRRSSSRPDGSAGAMPTPSPMPGTSSRASRSASTAGRCWPSRCTASGRQREALDALRRAAHHPARRARPRSGARADRPRAADPAAGPESARGARRSGRDVERLSLSRAAALRRRPVRARSSVARTMLASCAPAARGVPAPRRGRSVRVGEVLDRAGRARPGAGASRQHRSP